LEQTFVMIKPDGVQRNLVGEIVGRLEKKGLKLCALKMIQVSRDLAEEHYAEHREKPFFDELVGFITSGPAVAMIWEGLGAVQVVRRMMGSTNPQEAASGTIRGDYALFMGNNVVHGSDSLESASREITLFFQPEELITYTKALDLWVNG